MSTSLCPSMRRSILIAALRDQTLWPKGFQWNFSTCKTCGIGLFIQLTEGREADYNGEWHFIQDRLGLTGAQAIDVFGRSYNLPDHRVTSFVVADRLETLHQELEAVRCSA